MTNYRVSISATSSDPKVVTDVIDQMHRVAAELVLDGAEVHLAVYRDEDEVTP